MKLQKTGTQLVTNSDGTTTEGPIENFFFSKPQRFSRFLYDYADAIKSSEAKDKEDFLHFSSFAINNAHRSKAQLLQDIWALWETDEKRRGYFVEFGAASGLELSNTYLLEKEYEWNGILAEPNPIFKRKLDEYRNCQIETRCVYSNSNDIVRFMPAQVSELSRIATIVPEDQHEKTGQRSIEDGGEIEVQTISLNDLLEEHKAPETIDFMSVDTEGSEYEILQAFDFDRWNVRCLCVEHNATPAREKIKTLMEKNGFRRKWEGLTKFDDWYVTTD